MVDWYGSDAGRRFLSRQALGLAACGLVLFVAFGDGRLDLFVERLLFDAARSTFPLASQWLLKDVLHDAARTVSVLAAIALVALAIRSWTAARTSTLRAIRHELAFAATAVLVSACAVAALKHFSTHPCPWDLALFGGNAPYHPNFGTSPRPPGVAGCLPAAHPVAGYAWLGVGLALYPCARAAAARWSLGALVLGTLFGAVQVMRGAHFVSHVLWSAWVVWGVDLALLSSWVPLAAPFATARTRARPSLHGTK